MLEQIPFPEIDNSQFTQKRYCKWSEWQNGERDQELQSYADFYAENYEAMITALKALSDHERAAALFVLTGIAGNSVAEVLALLMPPDSVPW